jgi:hypothetical protein
MLTARDYYRLRDCRCRRWCACVRLLADRDTGGVGGQSRGATDHVDRCLAAVKCRSGREDAVPDRSGLTLNLNDRLRRTDGPSNDNVAGGNHAAAGRRSHNYCNSARASRVGCRRGRRAATGDGEHHRDQRRDDPHAPQPCGRRQPPWTSHIWRAYHSHGLSELAASRMAICVRGDHRSVPLRFGFPRIIWHARKTDQPPKV